MKRKSRDYRKSSDRSSSLEKRSRFDGMRTVKLSHPSDGNHSRGSKFYESYEQMKRIQQEKRKSRSRERCRMSKTPKSEASRSKNFSIRESRNRRRNSSSGGSKERNIHERHSALTPDDYPRKFEENMLKGELVAEYGDLDIINCLGKRHPFTVLPANLLLTLFDFAPCNFGKRTSEQLRVCFPVGSGVEHRDFERKDRKSVFPPPPKEKPDLNKLQKRKEYLKEALKRNTYNTEAEIDLHEVEKKLKEWEKLSKVPGKFTGSTDVRVLTKRELDVVDHDEKCAPRDDMFVYDQSYLPDRRSLGYNLLKRLGWAGAGKPVAPNGSLAPCDVKFTLERRGICGPEEEIGTGMLYNQLSSLEGRNPVAVLIEHCRTNCWGYPYYQLISETGPLHKRVFHYKVRVNNVDYVPHTGSTSKKQAKADAATGALFALGLT